VSQAIELAPDEPRVVKNPEIFVNALVERASVYKDLGLYTEAFADLDAAEDIIGGTDKRLDHAREAIKKEREEIQKETLLKEKMRRAAGHAPATEGLFASILRPFRNVSRAGESSPTASPQESADKGANSIEANLSESSPTASPQEIPDKGADLHEADLRETDLTKINLIKADLRKADFRGANLKGLDLSGANCWKADFTDANLQGANLRGTSFAHTRLINANLQGADLEGATFASTHTYEFGTDVSGADFRKTKGLTLQQLRSASGNRDTKLPDHVARPQSWSR
jgi:hypothetical protein